MSQDQTIINNQGRRLQYESFWISAALFLICVIIFSFPWLSGRVTIPWDAKAHFHPQFVFLSHALHSGQSPFWTPNVFAGMPQISDPQSLIFSPFFLLAAIFVSEPSFILEDSIVFSMLAMGGLALIAFFRDRNLSAAGGLIAALSFAFGGSAAWRVQHTGQVMSLAWLPVAFWLLSRAMDQRSIFYGALAGFVAALLLLGRDQVAFLGILLLATYAIYRVIDDDAPVISAINPLLAGLLVCGIAIIVPLAFTLQLALNSNRPEIGLKEAYFGSLPPGSFLTLICANLFGTDGPLESFWGPPSPAFGTRDIFLARNMTNLYAGELTLFAIIFAISGRFLKDREIRFFTGAAIFFMLYALGRFTPAFEIFYHIPGVDLWRRPADATFLLGFVFSILAGFSFTLIQRRETKLTPSQLIVIAFLLFAGVIIFATQKNHLIQAILPLGISVCFVVAALALLIFANSDRLKGPALLCSIAVILTGDLVANNGANESTALPPEKFDVLRSDSKDPVLLFLQQKMKENTFLDRRDRVELAAIDFHWPNIGLVHGFDHDLGYNPIRLKIFGDATGAGDHLALPEQRNFSKLYPAYRSLFSDMLGLRFIATGVPIEQIDRNYKPGSFNEIAQFGKVHIYENATAFPRAQIATCALNVDFKNMIETGIWPDVDYHETVLLEGPQLCHPRKNLSPDAIKTIILSYANDSILIQATAPAGGGWLVLYDVWQPWWFATVDDVSAPVLRSNVIFRAVPIPEGVHEVRFTFEPLRGFLKEFTGS